MSTSEKIAVIF